MKDPAALKSASGSLIHFPFIYNLLVHFFSSQVQQKLYCSPTRACSAVDKNIHTKHIEGIKIMTLKFLE